MGAPGLDLQSLKPWKVFISCVITFTRLSNGFCAQRAADPHQRLILWKQLFTLYSNIQKHLLNHLVVCADSYIFCVAVAQQHAENRCHLFSGCRSKKPKNWKKKHYTVTSIQPRLVPHPSKHSRNSWIADGGEEIHARAKEKCA